MANEDDRMVHALTARADQLDSEAATGEDEGQPQQSPEAAPGAQATRHPGLLRMLSAEFRALAEHIRTVGHQGATIYSDEPAQAGVLQVEKTDVPDPTPAGDAEAAPSSPPSAPSQDSPAGPASAVVSQPDGGQG